MDLLSQFNKVKNDVSKGIANFKNMTAAEKTRAIADGKYLVPPRVDVQPAGETSLIDKVITPMPPLAKAGMGIGTLALIAVAAYFLLKGKK
jgi:hypothetical protein